MPRSYPAEFRRKVLDLIEAGRPVAEVAEQLDVADQTTYNSRNEFAVTFSAVSHPACRLDAMSSYRFPAGVKPLGKRGSTLALAVNCGRASTTAIGSRSDSRCDLPKGDQT